MRGAGRRERGAAERARAAGTASEKRARADPASKPPWDGMPASIAKPGNASLISSISLLATANEIGVICREDLGLMEHFVHPDAPALPGA